MAQMQQAIEANSQAKAVLDNLIELGEVFQEDSGNVVVADDPPSKRRPGRPKKEN